MNAGQVTQVPPERATDELKLVTVRTGYQGSWSREETGRVGLRR